MDVKIDLANKNDIAEILNVKQLAYDSLENKNWYVIDGTDEKYLNNLLINGGIILKAIVDSKIVAFLIVARKLRLETEIVKEMNLQNIISSCIEYDNVAVLSEYRGNGIMRKMLSEAEKRLNDNSIKYLYTTVHPDNKASLNSFLASGFEIVKETFMYNGKRRYILMKENTI